MNTVDAQRHGRDLRRAAFPGLGPHLAPIGMSHRINDVRPGLQSKDVDGVVLVRAAGNAEDSDHMFAVADRAHEVVDRVWRALTAPLDELDPADRMAIPGGTATACYGPGEGA
jgi:hypothetical protein